MNKELRYSYEILHSVIVDKSYVSIELNKVLEGIESGVNTATITKIVYGVLEYDITLDYFISQFVKKSPSVDIMILLKIVAYSSKQVNGIPHFALVNEIVDLSKSIDSSAKPGQVLIANNKEGLIIRTGDGAVEITELLPINSKKMSAKSYLNGKKINIGSIVQ